ncbi:MAG: diguanylate cyclase [Actinomycetota bacterium]
MGGAVRKSFFGVVVLTALVVPLAPGGADLTWVAPVMGLLSVVVLVMGVRAHRMDRSLLWHVGRPEAWTLLGTGLASVVLADLIRTLTTGANGPLYPSIADAFMLPGYGAVAAGLILLIRGRAPGRAVDCAVVAAIGALTVALPAWVMIFDPAVARGELGGMAAFVTLLWPVLDVAVVLLTSRLMQLSDEHPGAYSYLFLALGTLLIVHCVTAVNVLGGIRYAYSGLEAPYILVYGLWGLAAMHPSMGSLFEPVVRKASSLTRSHFVGLGIVQLLGPLLLAVQRLRGVDVNVVSVIFGTALLSALVVGHLVHMVHERSQLEHAAEYDGLTGLPRPELFNDRVSLAVSAAHQRKGLMAVMFVDLDRFKKVNDSLGHQVGNQLLQLVAKRLRRCVRDGDTVGRQGGDEFTILLPEIKEEVDARRVADKIRAEFVEPFAIGDRRLFVTASIGVALYPQDGLDPFTLLKNADAAMYRAKERGRDQWQLYTPELNAKADERLDLESALHAAIDEGKLELHYQPKVELESGKVVGVEALVRWCHEGVYLPPETFIPLAEESGLVAPLGRWVMETACRQGKAWSDAGHHITVAVNLSARQFQLQDIDDVVAVALRESGLDPELLELELTESLALQDSDSIRDILINIKSMGVKCSIDDFGVGFSNLGYLGTLPIDKIKIDKSFVRRINDPDGKSALVVGIISLARGLGLEVVAEGVETKEELDFLRQHGCDQIQGYLFSRAIPADQLSTLLMLENLPGEGRLGKMEPRRAKRERPLRPLRAGK